MKRGIVVVYDGNAGVLAQIAARMPWTARIVRIDHGQGMNKLKSSVRFEYIDAGDYLPPRIVSEALDEVAGVHYTVTHDDLEAGAA